MKVKIPSSIKLGAYTYTLSLQENYKLNRGTWATTNHTLSEITIESALSPSERDLTLLHECLHIISEIYRLNLDEDNIERLQNGLGELLFRDLDIKFDWSEVRNE